MVGEKKKKGSHLPTFYFREPFGQVFTNYIDGATLTLFA